jgi:hypothetical protein
MKVYLLHLNGVFYHETMAEFSYNGCLFTAAMMLIRAIY